MKITLHIWLAAEAKGKNEVSVYCGAIYRRLIGFMNLIEFVRLI